MRENSGNDGHILTRVDNFTFTWQLGSIRFSFLIEYQQSTDTSVARLQLKGRADVIVNLASFLLAPVNQGTVYKENLEIVFLMKDLSKGYHVFWKCYLMKFENIKQGEG
jgi:hypothetical protein